MNLHTSRDIKVFALNLLSDYWGGRRIDVERLIIRQSPSYEIRLPVRLIAISLPFWAKHCGVNGEIFVPAEVVSSDISWQNIDWWYVIHWFSNCLAEREFERLNGSIHSYSFKLSGWDERMWKHAWVNRIAMFLYCWADHLSEKPGSQKIPKPTPAVVVTHDLDAINKTKAIRFKQTAFHTFNALKALKHLKFYLFVNKLAKAIAFFFRTETYMYLHKLNEGTNNPLISRKIINIYGGELGYKRSFKALLIDPSYDIYDSKLIAALLSLEEQGYEFGLHQSFKAWDDADIMYKQQSRVSSALSKPVKTCRQHWLRFSFKKTWMAQYLSGFNEDTTLGFNDREGFRSGLALALPLNTVDSRFEKKFSVLPMVLMDSHLYDYRSLTNAEARRNMEEMISEVVFVGGTVSVLWHPHTLGKDYGWEDGYRMLLDVLSEHT